MPLAILLLSTIVACGGQKVAPTAAADAASSAKRGLSGDFPSDAASQAFATALTGLTIEDFAAVDGMGAQVILTTLNFAGDNTWSAEGYVEAGDERMECSETGTWDMDAAQSATVATITWVIGQTDCVGREAGTETRAQLTLKGGDVDIAMR